MAIKKTEEPVIDTPKLSNREIRWKEHVAGYIAKNPVKGAAKEKRGEFNKIPDSFV